MSTGGTLLQLLVCLIFVRAAFQYCYKMNLLSFRSSQTPNYQFSMNLFKNNTISSTTTVLRDIPVPMWHLMLMQSTPSEQRVHYNGTIKVCEFFKFVKRVRVFKEVASFFLRPESGNMSLTCPMPKGIYVLQNVQVPPDTGILKFIYAPRSTYTLYGTVLSQLPDKSVDKLCTYEINATVVKRC